MLHFVAFSILALWIFANVAMTKMKCHWIVFVIVNVLIFIIGNLAGAGLKLSGI